MQLDEYLVKMGVPDRAPLEPNSTKNQQHKIWKLGYTDEEQIKALGKDQATYLIDVLLALGEHQNELLRQDAEVAARGTKTKRLFIIAVVSFLLTAGLSLVDDPVVEFPRSLASIAFMITTVWGIVSGFKYFGLKLKYRKKKTTLNVQSNIAPRGQ